MVPAGEREIGQGLFGPPEYFPRLMMGVAQSQIGFSLSAGKILLVGLDD